MVKKCQRCGQSAYDDAVAFCKYCGNKFPEKEIVLLHQIRDDLKDTQELTNKSNISVLFLTIGLFAYTAVLLLIGERNFIIQYGFTSTELYIICAILGFYALIGAGIYFLFRKKK
jgi:uncharacterized membrane protein YvbJ